MNIEYIEQRIEEIEKKINEIIGCTPFNACLMKLQMIQNDSTKQEMIAILQDMKKVYNELIKELLDEQVALTKILDDIKKYEHTPILKYSQLN